MQFFKNAKAICCHTCRVNCLTEYHKNQSVHESTTVVQTFFSLKEIKIMHGHGVTTKMPTILQYVTGA